MSLGEPGGRIDCFCSEMEKQSSETSCQSFENCKAMFTCRLMKITRAVILCRPCAKGFHVLTVLTTIFKEVLCYYPRIMDEETDVFIVLGTC